MAETSPPSPTPPRSRAAPSTPGPRKSARSRLELPGWVNRIGEYRMLVLPVGFVMLLSVIVVPMPPVVMDLLIAANLALAAIVLLTTIFIERPLDFSSFPSLLLGLTLFRLVLNIATTRLILSADASSADGATAVAGRVIEAFSDFVSGGSLVVGMVLFGILIVVQFVVITKGATRISEVAARFTLDGMPGKQMAVDADLNAGLINEEQARTRRSEITQEADFHGAMDGAAKFVRGDAVAGIIITMVNIVGGFAVGVFEKGWSAGESMEVFTRLTIGDGLVSQMPAFIVAIAAGLIVTRSSSRQDLGTELIGQLTHRLTALIITSVFLGLMSLVPGLPMFPLLLLSVTVGVIAYMVHRGRLGDAVVAAKNEAAKEDVGPPPVEELLSVDRMELEVGYGLVKLVDTTQGGDLLDRITMIRRQLASELGMVMPPVRIRDNMQLDPHAYHIKIRGNSIADGQVYPGQYLAMDNGLADPEAATLLNGRPTTEPAFGLPAMWIEASQKNRAEQMSFTSVDAVSVLATHMTEVVKNHAHELMTREETANLVTQLREKSPKLVEEVLGTSGGGGGGGGEDKAGVIKPGQLQRILQNLLRERVPIRDMETIIETLGDWATRTQDIEVLTEYVRNALRRTICGQFVEMIPGDRLDHAMPKPMLYCVSLDPAMEDQVSSYIDRTSEGTTMSMPPAVANRITTALLTELQQLIGLGHHPVVLASPQVRGQIRRLLEPHLPTAAVLGYNEVSKGVEVESVGLVQLDTGGGEKGEGGPGGQEVAA